MTASAPSTTTGEVVGSPLREYVYSGGHLIAKIDSSGAKYYHQDQLSNRLVTDSSGNTLSQLGAYPYGDTWYNATNDKLFFTTYERDAESGNDYATMRYGVNRLGRFSSPDPLPGSVATPQSLNRFPYVHNDPINSVDPTGLRDHPYYFCPPGGNMLFSTDCNPGGDLFGGNCAVNGIATSCGIVQSLLGAGAAVQCPNNICEGLGIDASGNTIFAEFYAFAGGTSGYFNHSDISQGVWEWNGQIYSASGWAAYLDNLRELAREALADAISLASNSPDGSNWDDIYENLNYVGTKGGNADFSYGGNLASLGLGFPLGDTGTGCEWSCREGSMPSLHFNNDSFHLDTANPSWGFGFGFLIHGLSDVLIGNINPGVPMVH